MIGKNFKDTGIPSYNDLAVVYLKKNKMTPKLCDVSFNFVIFKINK